MSQDQITSLLIQATTMNIAYFIVVTGILSLLLYVIFKKFTEKRRITNKKMSKKRMFGDFLRSIRTIIVQVLSNFSFIIFFQYQINYDPNYSMGFILLEFLIMLILHDAYFYWSHRLLHTKYMFKYVHSVHHRTKHPVTWTSYSFSIGEAFISNAFVPIVLFFTTLHIDTLFMFAIYILVINGLGHSGIDFFPSWWVKMRFFTSPTHHSMHHEKTNGNFGLTWRIWDRLMGTEFEDYEERFEKVKAGKRDE